MNEKLFEIASELSKQASDWVDEVYPSAGYKPRARQNHYRTKFAELIVRECCDIFVELRTRPADLAVKDVKKHFGVE